jgi:hypothetical protein
MDIAILGSGVAGDGAGETASDHELSLESGYIDGGSASAPVGVGWYDTSKETDYGHGNRYSNEETRFMARVPSKHK